MRGVKVRLSGFEEQRSLKRGDASIEARYDALERCVSGGRLLLLTDTRAVGCLVVATSKVFIR